MVHKRGHKDPGLKQGTRITTQEEVEREFAKEQLELLQRRKRQDPLTAGLLPDPSQVSVKEERRPTPPASPGSIVLDAETGRQRGFINSAGNFVSATKGDIDLSLGKGVGGQVGTAPTAEQSVLGQQLQQQGQQLAGQIGEFGELGVQPTGFDFAEAGIAGLRTAIPSAIGSAASIFAAGLIGAKVGVATGALATPIGAAIGAALGFSGGIVAGILSNMKEQRTDTTTAQQRVLDEGKQTLQDWVTLARSDPSLRLVALRGFNAQLALIDQAFRMMKLDTQRDLLKFENALPNLAEFNAFYNFQGERDFLSQEMRLALLTPSTPDFAMLELANRRVG